MILRTVYLHSLLLVTLLTANGCCRLTTQRLADPIPMSTGKPVTKQTPKVAKEPVIIRGQQPTYGGSRISDIPSAGAVRASDQSGASGNPYQPSSAKPYRYPAAKPYRQPTAQNVPASTPNPRYSTPNPRYSTAPSSVDNTGSAAADTPWYRKNQPYPTSQTNGVVTGTNRSNPEGQVPVYRTAQGTATPYTPQANRTPVTPYPAGAGLEQPPNASGASANVPPVKLAQYTGARNSTPFLPSTPLVATPYPTPIDLDVMLEEAQTGRIMFGVGVNSDSGLLGNVVIDEQNFDLFRWPTGLDDWRNGQAFRGAGQQFRLEALPGTELQRYSMSFAEPYLFNSSVSFGLSAFYYERQYINWDERRWGARGSLGYIFPDQPDLSTTFSTRYEEINILDPSVPTPPVLQEVVGENQLIAFRWDVMHDTRDNAYLPSEGHLIELAFDQAIGTWQYPTFVLDGRQYFVVRQRPDGSGRHTLGLAGTFGVTGSDTPIYDNFYAGGFATIRGFFFRGASPKVGDVIVGGHLQALTSAEYLFPLTASDNVFGAFFVDAGTVERNMSIDWSNVRISPGFELRLNVPALGPVPLALGFAVPVQRAPTDRIRNFHFFVGLSR
ncbi:MAG: hypothetical protein CMJ74_10185 [Planctomycetaceae bacterium]|nr:hypothetical protein [Planctomycetaceae bacterium]|tara:strand:- start:10244 stop:12073 length:1830 start_codon:yes stop_codon:yes gene_type:complete